MKAILFSIAAVLAPHVVLAQTATTSATSSSSTCAADYIVEDCLSSTTARQQACGQQDYSCLCPAYQAIETCFNNCPGDPRQSTYQGLVTQYCALASQYSTTNTVRATSTSAGVSGVSTSDATDTSTATSSGSSSSSTANSGPQLVKGAGGVLAAVAGVAAALL